MRLLRHETKPGNVGLVKRRSDARQRHPEAVAHFRVEIDATISIGQPFADRTDMQCMSPQPPDGLRVCASPPGNRAQCEGGKASELTFTGPVVEAAATDHAWNGIRRVKVPRDGVARQTAPSVLRFG